MRVKLLEAFAAGIPVVSTIVGAEGLADKDGELCALSDDPAGFAQRVLKLFDDPVAARRWPRARGGRWKPTGIWRRSLANWWTATGDGAGEANVKLTSCPSHVFLETAYNIGGDAIRLLGGGILGKVICGPKHLARFGIHQEYRALVPGPPGTGGGLVSLLCGSAKEPPALGSPCRTFRRLWDRVFRAGTVSMTSRCSWRASPTWSVRTASAILGSVTITKTCSLVRVLARYCSSPWAMGSHVHGMHRGQIGAIYGGKACHGEE